MCRNIREREREREGETETERDRQTDRQRQRQRQTETDRDTETDGDGQRDRVITCELMPYLSLIESGLSAGQYGGALWHGVCQSSVYFQKVYVYVNVR